MNNLDSIKLVNGAYEYTFENISDPIGFDYATTRLSIEDLAGKKSAEYITSKFGRRRLSWKSVLMECDLDKVVDIQRAIDQGSLKTIYFSAYPNRELQTDIEIDRFTMPPRAGRRVMMIEAVAPDWRFYSQIQYKKTIYKTVPTGGADIPADIPLDIYGAYNFNNVIQVNGSHSTPPTMRIDGPFRKVYIGNSRTNEVFSINYSLPAGQYITVNASTGDILLNGVSNLYGYKSGNLWDLLPDNNTVTFLPFGDGENTALTIYWREAHGEI